MLTRSPNDANQSDLGLVAGCHDTCAWYPGIFTQSLSYSTTLTRDTNENRATTCSQQCFHVANIYFYNFHNLYLKQWDYLQLEVFILILDHHSLKEHYSLNLTAGSLLL